MRGDVACIDEEVEVTTTESVSPGITVDSGGREVGRQRKLLPPRCLRTVEKVM